MLLNDGANLKFELQRDDEVHQKNVDIGEQISILLKSENIREKSLSKRNKFCLDLFHAQQPTTDVKNSEVQFWQEQQEYNEWSKDRLGNERKFWFQFYIQGLYRSLLVAHFDITKKTKIAVIHFLICAKMDMCQHLSFMVFFSE